MSASIEMKPSTCELNPCIMYALRAKCKHSVCGGSKSNHGFPTSCLVIESHNPSFSYVLHATLVLLTRIILENPSAGLRRSTAAMFASRYYLLAYSSAVYRARITYDLSEVRHLNEQNYSYLDCWHDSDQFDDLVFS